VNVRVNAKKGGGSLSQQINGLHSSIQEAHLNLFDDRVFIAEDRADAERLLHMNPAKNPIVKAINPLLAKVIQMFEIEISLFRATFNILFWKGDPMLSYLALIVVFCLMIVLAVFPWQKLFFIVGLFGLGPQNYFLGDWYSLKLSEYMEEWDEQIRQDDVNRKNRASRRKFDQSDSTLLIRNNAKAKQDGRHREIIIPSAPLRSNRFYDWPPDPDSTTVE